MNVRWLSSAILLVTLAGAASAQTALDDARLQPAAGELRGVFQQAVQDGVPDELLADKVREGLAKGVPPARIAQVVRGLEQALARARVEAGSAAGKELLKAIVDAHAAGVGAPALKPLLGTPARARAVEVLTDLAQRGYPSEATAQLVARIGARDAAALEHLAGQLERARTDSGLSYVEAVDTLNRATGQGASLERALQALRHDRSATDDLRGPPRDSMGPRGPGRGKGRGHN
jgi:hypothetical protein